MIKNPRSALIGLALFLVPPAAALASDVEALRQQVEDTERAFAQTMADRDFEAFKSFLAQETIFFAGETPIRGSDEVAAAWAGFYEGTEPPFSWEPETVAVLDSGTLALSSGPVSNPEGKRVATFQSIWRIDSDGQWKVVFDKGSRYCEPPTPPTQD